MSIIYCETNYKMTRVIDNLLSLLVFTILFTMAISDGETWRCMERRWYDRKFNYRELQRLADHVDGVLPNDLFYDRLVYIHHEGTYDAILSSHKRQVYDQSVTLDGVLITEKLVLTSWNPYRNVIRFRFKRHFTHVCVTWRRRYESYEYDIAKYQRYEFEVNCARPVYPLRNEEVPGDLWHGNSSEPQMHSPLHDLIVLRIRQRLKGLLPNQTIKSTDYWSNRPKRQWTAIGPLLTSLANETDTLGRNLKFAMLRKNYIREYDVDENVITDCDEWIPRSWGWFICLRNIDDLRSLASGSMLFHNEMLFGVGSFALFKGNHSILVFTDVRKYNKLIFNTCTPEDQNFKPPATPRPPNKPKG